MTSFLPRPTAAGSARLAYEVRGEGPLVVTIPGMGDLRSADAGLADALVDDGFRVATVDQRNLGDSERGFDVLGDEATASDYLTIIEELGGPAVVVGTSMSASAALIAAAERPDLVRAVVALSPFVRNAGGNPAINRLLFRMLFARPWGVAAWTAYYRSTLNRGQAPADHAEHVAAIRTALSQPGRLADFRRLAVELDHAPAEARAGDVRVPVLAVIGALDPDYTDPAAELAHIAEVVPGARTLLVDDAAHYPHRQRPDVVLPAVRAFVAEAAARA
ncbi:alpha/beta fold hydrolase [Protaetiibacter sp. SSC-01]|uniref:alpha/beta fold hydrolase n=1 Tax=Protaetiibacter sp. SSC-01 TaxID=2759943 RepID=UPI001656CBF2|nr:alpha/beta fold hydrolase [Protaetiibacter sp. SSC-01]QNO38302.1 alpha/beta fold hydrolase [Protaetiibacter sp. SSC-01]